tara:strand:+ start:19 stop:261 length:243 start_codon:yes stop_codon:yes gene_type:complete
MKISDRIRYAVGLTVKEEDSLEQDPAKIADFLIRSYSPENRVKALKIIREAILADMLSEVNRIDKRFDAIHAATANMPKI